MVKKNDNAMIFLIIVGLLIAVYVGSTLNKTPNTVLVTSTGKVVNSSVGSSLACAGVSLLPNFQLTAVYNDTAIVPAQINSAYTLFSLYKQGANSAQNTTFGSSATFGSLVCGGQYSAFVGSYPSYYLVEVPLTITNVTGSKQVILTQISSPAITYNNGTIAGYVKQAVFGGIANGYTETNLNLKIAQSGYGYFGDPSYALVFAFNSSQISSVTLSEPIAQNVPLSPLSIPAGFTTVAYSLPSIGNYQSVILNPIVKIGTLNSNSLIASDMDVYAIAQAPFKYNGQYQTGYIYPNNNTAIISPVTSTTSSSAGVLIYG